MTPAELETALVMRGVTVYTRGGELRYLAPPGAWTDEMRKAAALYRDVLLRMAAAAAAALDKESEAEYRRAIAREASKNVVDRAGA